MSDRLPRRLRHRAAADNIDRHMPRAPRGSCGCSHHAVLHGNTDLRCEVPGCGCRVFRADEQQPTPGRFRDNWDDSALPRVRNIDMPPWIEDVQP